MYASRNFYRETFITAFNRSRQFRIVGHFSKRVGSFDRFLISHLLLGICSKGATHTMAKRKKAHEAGSRVAENTIPPAENEVISLSKRAAASTACFRRRSNCSARNL